MSFLPITSRLAAVPGLLDWKRKLFFQNIFFQIIFFPHPELRHAPELDVGPVRVVEHRRVRHRHPGRVHGVLVRHAHLLGEGLHWGHIAAIQQQLLGYNFMRCDQSENLESCLVLSAQSIKRKDPIV